MPLVVGKNDRSAWKKRFPVVAFRSVPGLPAGLFVWVIPNKLCRFSLFVFLVFLLIFLSFRGLERWIVHRVQCFMCAYFADI